MVEQPRVPIPPGVKKRDAKLYGIAGWLSQLPDVECAAFGGYFRYDVLDRVLVDGQLIDLWGSSSIEGTMTENELRFTKMYEHRSDPISYRFRMQNGIWVGEYNGPETGRGRAQCKTFVAEEDAFSILCGKPRIV